MNNDNSRSGILEVTRGAPKLVHPPSMPAGEQWYYGMAIPFQVSADIAGLLCCFRDVGSRGHDHIDFEAGSDAVLFDDLAGVTAADAVPINRNHEAVNPRADAPAIMVKHPVITGFVPFGAKRPDGTPHPHAGTGFGMSPIVAYPTGRTEKGLYYYLAFQGDQAYSYIELFQFRYDGERFLVEGVEEIVDPGDWLGGYRLNFCCFTTPVPDGDDFLLPMNGARGDDPFRMGLSRWRRGADGWRPVDFSVVSDIENQSEMSIVRDVDGSLLYSARGNDQQTCHNFRVWRSTDNGESWQDCLKVLWVRSAAPVTINQAVDGTPFILANLYETPLIGTADTLLAPREPDGWCYLGGIRRDKLYAWPLTADRENLEAPLLVRDCPADFGPPPGGSTWSADHPMALALRLADGQWHNVLTYRGLEHGENGRGCPPTPHTGCYIEEIISSGPARPVWRF